MARTEEKREEFAGRVASALESGIVPWDVAGTAPESGATGRRYTGLNALFLMERAMEKNYADPRWMTLKDAGKCGFTVNDGEKGTHLEHWEQKDGKTRIYNYVVFNVGQMSGSGPGKDIPAFLPPEPNYGRADALLIRAGTEPPVERTPEACAAALAEAFGKRAEEAEFPGVHTDALKQLRLHMAQVFVAQDVLRETGFDIRDREPQEQAQSWGRSIRNNPVELFRAGRDAERLAAGIAKDWGLTRENVSSLQIRTGREAAETVNPQVGDRVTFHPKGTRVTLTGTVMGLDEDKGTVSLQCGGKVLPLFRGSGYFTEAAPLKPEETKEYAVGEARKLAGEKGQVFFAADNGTYRGPIVGTTPCYALQKTGENTVVLHRLKDLSEKELPGGELAIEKKAGQATVRKAEKETAKEQKKEKERACGR